MSKFSLIEGPVFLYDADGLPIKAVNSDGNRLPTQGKILGADGLYEADVILQGGVKRVATTSIALVESLLGEVVFPYTWIEVHDIGGIGDTMRTQIPGDGVDVTTTRTANEVTVNDLAKKHRDELNNNSNFDAFFEASVPRASHLVCMQSKLIQTVRDFGGAILHTNTGTMETVLEHDTFLDRPIALAIFPHPKDCRKGTINVTGEIGVLETGRPPKRLLLMDSAGNFEQNINGSTTPTTFTLRNNPVYQAHQDQDMIVTELRIEATSGSINVGAGKYIRVGMLANGHRFQVRSDGELEYDENLKLSEDIHHAFAFGVGSKFEIFNTAGDGSLVAVFARPFFIRKEGTFGIPDDIIVDVRDDFRLIERLRVSAVGFFED